MAPTILVLEDDSALRDLLCEVLQEEGYRVVAASTLSNLIEAVPPQVDLLISDVLVDLEPVGIDAIHAVRELGHTNVPTILCTGATKQIEYYQEQILQLGAVVLPKPFTIDGLLQAVESALANRPLIHELR